MLPWNLQTSGVSLNAWTPKGQPLGQSPDQSSSRSSLPGPSVTHCSPELCDVLILTCRTFSKCHAGRWLVSKTLLGKWQIAALKNGTAVNLKEKSVSYMKVRRSWDWLPFVQNVDVIGVYCVDEAKQVFQYGLEHAQWNNPTSLSRYFRESEWGQGH